MSRDVHVPDPLGRQELRKLVLDALENTPSDETPETFHALFDHLERGLSTDDVIHALESDWELGRKPKFNYDEWQWKYEIHGESVDGQQITIVIAVDTIRREFTVITRWRDDS
jgi:hypothetical protein